MEDVPIVLAMDVPRQKDPKGKFLHRHLQLLFFINSLHFEWTKVMHVPSELCSAAVSEFITMNFNLLCIQLQEVLQGQELRIIISINVLCDNLLPTIKDSTLYYSM